MESATPKIAEPSPAPEQPVDMGCTACERFPGSPMTWWRTRRPETLVRHDVWAAYHVMAAFPMRENVNLTLLSLAIKGRASPKSQPLTQEVMRPLNSIAAEPDCRLDTRGTAALLACLADRNGASGFDPFRDLLSLLQHYRPENGAFLARARVAARACRRLRKHGDHLKRCMLCENDLRAWLGEQAPDAEEGDRGGDGTDDGLAGPALTVGVPPAPDLETRHARDQNLNAYGALWAKPMRLVGDADDPDRIARTLSAEFPWMEEAVAFVREELVLRRRYGVEYVTFRPLLLHGGAGVGKTRFVRRLCAEVGLPFAQTGGGASDARDLLGTSRGWGSAQASAPVRAVLRHGCANLAVFVDEIDKAADNSANGRISDGLLSMMEPLSAERFHDPALAGDVNLSKVNWMLAANEPNVLPRPLATRLTFVRVPEPSAEHYDVIRDGVLRDLAAELDVTPDRLDALPEPRDKQLRNDFQAKRDVRRLKRHIRSALADVANLAD